MYIFLNLSCLLKLPQHMFRSNTCLLGVYLDPQFDWLLYLWKTCSTGIWRNNLTVLSISKEMGVSKDDYKHSKYSSKRSIRTENFTTSMRFIVGKSRPDLKILNWKPFLFWKLLKYANLFVADITYIIQVLYKMVSLCWTPTRTRMSDPVLVLPHILSPTVYKVYTREQNPARDWKFRHLIIYTHRMIYFFLKGNCMIINRL